MSVLEKLHIIERLITIYAVLYRNAGVGFQFYEGSDLAHQHPLDHRWRKHLHVYGYHETFEKAVEAEYERLREAAAIALQPDLVLQRVTCRSIAAEKR